MPNATPRHHIAARIAGTLVLVAVVLAGCSIFRPERATETRNLSHETDAPPTLLQVVAQDGSIDVQKDSAVKGISVTAKLTAGGKTVENAKARLKETRIEITEPSAGEVSIKAVWPSPFTEADEVSFSIRMPDLQGFNGRSSNGRITVDSAAGPITIVTSNGDVSVTGSKQSLEVDTSNGDVDIRDHVGDIEIDTSNGDVDIANLTGGASVKTSNSRVTVTLSDESTKPLKLKTSNDDINLTCGTGWNGVISADTSNDGIAVEGAKDRIKSQSIKEDSGTITVGSGGETSRLNTSNGWIRITVR